MSNTQRNPFRAEFERIFDRATAIDVEFKVLEVVEDRNPDGTQPMATVRGEHRKFERSWP